MSSVILVPAKELMAERIGSVNPLKFPDEDFELYSIPAFDAGKPEYVKGAEIGSSKQLVQPGDVLLSKIVPHIRRSWIVGPNKGKRIIASGEWIVFRSSKVLPEYLRHILISDSFHTKFMSTVSGVGGSLLRARPAFVSSIDIPVPPKENQRKIADILVRSETIKQYRYEVMNKFDELIDSLFDTIFLKKDDSSWPSVKLEEVSEIITGYPFKSELYKDSGDLIKLCRGANVLPGRLDWKDIAQWPTTMTHGLGEYYLKAEDILIALDRPWISEGFKITQIREEDCPALLVQRVARIRSKEPLESVFLYHLLRQGKFQQHCRPTETTIPHISPKEVKSFVFKLPPSELQKEFKEIINQVEQLKNTSTLSLNHIGDLLKAVQQQVVTEGLFGK